jgi:hypothetical protein
MLKIKTLLIILLIAIVGMAGCELDSVNRTITENNEVEINRAPCYDLVITTGNFNWADHLKYDTKRVDFKVLNMCGCSLSFVKRFDSVFRVLGPFYNGTSGSWKKYYYLLQLANPDNTRKNTKNSLYLKCGSTTVAYDSININVC